MNHKNVKSIIFFQVFFLMLILTSALWAEGKIDRKKVTLLKWMGPGKPGTYEEYMAQRPKGTFRINREDNRNPRSTQKVLVIADSSIYSSLETEILRYANSLIASGYDAPVYQSSYGTAEDLKNFIKNNQTNLVGCVFIGDLPAAWYEVANDFEVYGYAYFPCDLFLMDLDGNWIDSDANGLYDDHTNGSGDREPEIFVGRIDLSRMSGNEVDNLRAFFDRDNQYWTGNMNLVKYGLTYTEDDWVAYPDFLHGISNLYGSDYQAIVAPYTDKSDYLNNRLSDIAYEFIQLSCHSSPILHAFNRGGYCYYNEIQAVPPQCLGVNLFCCSSNRFTTNNFLGAAYLHHSGPKALTVIGSTKTGSMLDFNYFYTPLGQNKCMGVAFKEWFEAIAPYDIYDVYWHYGMAVVGDPMITFLRPEAASTFLLWTSDSIAHLWKFNASGEWAGAIGYGNAPGWTATSYQKNSDGSSQLLWTSDGTAHLWKFNSSGGWAGATGYGYTSGWTATAHQRNGDGSSQLLWTRDGSAHLWKFNSSGGWAGATGFGYSSGWIATSYQKNSDGSSQLLWTSNGLAHLWKFNSSGGMTGATGYGNASGWTATSYHNITGGLTSAQQISNIMLNYVPDWTGTSYLNRVEPETIMNYEDIPGEIVQNTSDTVNHVNFPQQIQETDFEMYNKPEVSYIIIKKAGTGVGTIIANGLKCGNKCVELIIPYDKNTVETLRVMPDADSYFVGWKTSKGGSLKDIRDALPGEVLIAVFDIK